MAAAASLCPFPALGGPPERVLLLRRDKGKPPARWFPFAEPPFPRGRCFGIRKGRNSHLTRQIKHNCLMEENADLHNSQLPNEADGSSEEL